MSFSFTAYHPVDQWSTSGDIWYFQKARSLQGGVLAYGGQIMRAGTYWDYSFQEEKTLQPQDVEYGLFELWLSSLRSYVPFIRTYFHACQEMPNIPLNNPPLGRLFLQRVYRELRVVLLPTILLISRRARYPSFKALREELVDMFSL